MFLLRLTQHTESTHHYHVELSLEGDGARQTANPRFEFKLDEQDNDDVRWYMEDYLQYRSILRPRLPRALSSAWPTSAHSSLKPCFNRTMMGAIYGRRCARS